MFLSQARWIVGGVALLGIQLSVLAAAPIDVARFTCEFRKKEDTFQIVVPKPGAEVFRIRSATGIGDGIITCREGTWPEKITVLFVGMGSLEGLSIEGNGVTLAGRIGRDFKPALHFFNERGEELPNEKGSAYRLAIEYRKDEGMRVALTPLPAARTTKTWKLNWIDAYRR